MKWRAALPLKVGELYGYGEDVESAVQDVLRLQACRKEERGEGKIKCSPMTTSSS